MLCMLYVNALSLGFGLIAAALDRATPAEQPRRWWWVAAMLLSVVVPASYRWLHTSPVAFGTDNAPVAPVLSAWPVVSAALALLLIGGEVWALRIARSAQRLTHGRRASTVVDGVRVTATDTAGPAVTGFWRPTILMPRWALALPSGQRRFVVRHEDEHRRSGDVRLLAVGAAAVILLPWNIPFWWMIRRLNLAIELDCDERVVRALGDPTAYASTLVRIAEVGGTQSLLRPALIGGTGALERRVIALMAPARPSQLVRVAAAVAAVMLLAIALAAPHPIPAPAMHAGQHQGAP